jgi:hypothetical protein
MARKSDPTPTPTPTPTPIPTDALADVMGHGGIVDARARRTKAGAKARDVMTEQFRLIRTALDIVYLSAPTTRGPEASLARSQVSLALAHAFASVTASADSITKALEALPTEAKEVADALAPKSHGKRGRKSEGWDE